MKFTGHDRKYAVPRALRAAAGMDTATAWDLLSVANQEGVVGEWADALLDTVIEREEKRSRDALDCDGDCEDLGYYGIPDAADEDLLSQLVRQAPDGTYEVFTAAGWAPHVPAPDQPAEILSFAEAAELATVLAAGGRGVLQRFVTPVAWLPPSNDILTLPLSAAVEAAAAVEATETEEGWHTYAVVDDMDTGAVLNLIRLSPGPRLEEYVNPGGWQASDELLEDLRGVTPPMLTELDEDTTASVISQIDTGADVDEGHYESAEGVEAVETMESEAVANEATDSDDTVGAPTKADAPTTAAVSPDPRAEKLRRYWSIGGKGGLKIRWGTPGDWRRCRRYLSKYMGPRAKGYCQNLHKRNTGVWTGSRLNASATWPTVSTEAALAAAIESGTYVTPTGEEREMKDGVYSEAVGRDEEIMQAITAGAFPVAPPDEWFDQPKLDGPTPLTVLATGQVYGHIATFDVAHIGLPGKVHAPRSKSNYAYFHTGEIVTASGARVPVGQLTLAGGHAPLNADAGAAVAHYDNTASAVVDMRLFEDKYGIVAAGAVRPEVTEEDVRALRASAPSGDWRPINGNLELVAVCQVNVPGFPVTRARVASGAVMALVAAGARPLAEQRFAAQADAALADRVRTMEAALIASGMLASAGAEEPVEIVEDADPLPEGEADASKGVVVATPEKDADDAPKKSAEERFTAIREKLKERRLQTIRERAYRGAVPMMADGSKES